MLSILVRSSSFIIQQKINSGQHKKTHRLLRVQSVLRMGVSEAVDTTTQLGCALCALRIFLSFDFATELTVLVDKLRNLCLPILELTEQLLGLLYFAGPQLLDPTIHVETDCVSLAILILYELSPPIPLVLEQLSSELVDPIHILKAPPLHLLLRLRTVKQQLFSPCFYRLHILLSCFQASLTDLLNLSLLGFLQTFISSPRLLNLNMGLLISSLFPAWLKRLILLGFGLQNFELVFKCLNFVVSLPEFSQSGGVVGVSFFLLVYELQGCVEFRGQFALAHGQIY